MIFNLFNLSNVRKNTDVHHYFNSSFPYLHGLDGIIEADFLQSVAFLFPDPHVFLRKVIFFPGDRCVFTEYWKRVTYIYNHHTMPGQGHTNKQTKERNIKKENQLAVQSDYI